MPRHRASGHQPTRAPSAASGPHRESPCGPLDGALAIDSDWTNAHITAPLTVATRCLAIIESLLAEASQVLQGKPELEAASYGIGPKPIPGDGEPARRVDHVNGLYVAFTHSGATLGLIAGELLAYEIITGASHQCWLSSTFAALGRRTRNIPAVLRRITHKRDDAHLRPALRVHVAGQHVRTEAKGASHACTP